MSGMHLLPIYFTTTNTRKCKKKKKTKALLAAEREHQKFLKRMGVGSRRLKQRPSTLRVTESSSVKNADSPVYFHPCTKKDESYKKEVSSKYVIGQAYNKGGLQVLSKTEQRDPSTGKRR
jgi:hypothetical protein